MDGRALRVLQIAHTVGHGGLERQVLDLAGGLRAAGHHVVLALRPDGWMARQADALELPWLPVRFRGVLDPLSHGRIAMAVRRSGFDVVHGHSRRSACYSALAGRIGACRSVATVHSMGSWKGFGHNQRVIAVSDAVRDGLLSKGLDASQVVRIHNGVRRMRAVDGDRRRDARAALGLPADGVVVGMLGRIVPHKGHDLLLQALGLLGAAAAKMHLCLLGDTQAGPWPATLRRMAGTLGIDARVHMPGFQADPAAALPALDILVQPSRTEALSLALLEAMALGLPVVAARTGGMPEVVSDTQDGLLFAPGDVAGLAGALLRLQDEELRWQLGARARDTQRARFCSVDMVARTVALYRGVLAVQP